jgi:hypothetical protein
MHRRQAISAGCRFSGRAWVRSRRFVPSNQPGGGRPQRHLQAHVCAADCLPVAGSPCCARPLSRVENRFNHWGQRGLGRADLRDPSGAGGLAGRIVHRKLDRRRAPRCAKWNKRARRQAIGRPPCGSAPRFRDPTVHSGNRSTSPRPRKSDRPLRGSVTMKNCPALSRFLAFNGDDATKPAPPPCCNQDRCRDPHDRNPQSSLTKPMPIVAETSSGTPFFVSEG